MSKDSTHDQQAREFVRFMRTAGWTPLTTWVDGGHTFELLSKNDKTILVQTYPKGHGFQVWRPVTKSNTIAETQLAVKQYDECDSEVEELEPKTAPQDMAALLD